MYLYNIEKAVKTGFAKIDTIISTLYTVRFNLSETVNQRRALEREYGALLESERQAENVLKEIDPGKGTLRELLEKEYQERRAKRFEFEEKHPDYDRELRELDKDIATLEEQDMKLIECLDRELKALGALDIRS